MRVVCVCGQSGAAASLLPVIAYGEQHSKWNVSSFIYGEAITRYLQEHRSHQQCPVDVTQEDAEKILADNKPSVVLLGSDAQRHVEKRFLRAAVKLNIPTAMSIDFWANYKSRLTDESGMVLPDIINVVDEEMKSGLREVGVPPDRIFVTGSPALEQSCKNIVSVSASDIRHIRQELGIGQTDVAVLFASSPSSPDDFNEHLTMHDTHSLVPFLEDLLGELAQFSLQAGVRVHVVIRPHPRETNSAFDKLKSDHVGLLIDASIPVPLAMAMADCVIGLDSMFLLEAAAVGKSTISLGFIRPINTSIGRILSEAGVLVDKPGMIPQVLANLWDGEAISPENPARTWIDELVNDTAKTWTGIVTRLAREYSGGSEICS